MHDLREHALPARRIALGVRDHLLEQPLPQYEARVHRAHRRRARGVHVCVRLGPLRALARNALRVRREPRAPRRTRRRAVEPLRRAAKRE